MNQAQQTFIFIVETLHRNIKYMHNKESQFMNPSSKTCISELQSPMASPLPLKVLPVKRKNNNNLNNNNTFDGKYVDDIVRFNIPKLNLEKALQIQNINCKRSTQPIKYTEEGMLNKIKLLENNIIESKLSLQQEILLSKHYQIENEQVRRTILQYESDNEILAKSNMRYQENY